MGQQYSEMKCPSATAIFELVAESIKVWLASATAIFGLVGVDQGWVGTVLPQVLLRWMPSLLPPLVVAAVSAAAAAADDDDDDGGGGCGDDDDDDNDNDDNYDDDDDAFLGLKHL